MTFKNVSISYDEATGEFSIAYTPVYTAAARSVAEYSNALSDALVQSGNTLTLSAAVTATAERVLVTSNEEQGQYTCTYSFLL